MSEPGGIDAGPLYVDVVADTTGFGRDLQQKINAEVARVKATIKAEADTTKAETDLAKLAAKERTAKVKAEAEVRTAELDLAKVAAAERVAQIKAEAQTQRAEADLASAAAKKRVAEIKAEANVQAAELDLAKLAAAERVAEIKAEAQTARAEQELARVAAKERTATIQAAVEDARAEADLDRIAAKQRTVELRAEVDAAKAEADLERIAAKRRIAQIQAEADTLNAERKLDEAARRRTAKIDVDTSSLDKAGNALTGLGTGALGLLKFPAIASGISMAAGALAQVAAGLFAVASAAAPAVGLLGAIPGLIAGAAQGIGTIITGFAGIGDAVKKSSAAEAAAGTASAAASAQRQAAVERVAAAQDRVKQSQASLANAEANAAHAVQQAQQSVATAHEEAARSVQRAQQAVVTAQQETVTQVTAAQRALVEAHQSAAAEISRAEQQVVSAHQQAAQNVAQAERQLMTAQQDATQAQRDLIQARQDAARQLEDLNASVQDGRLSVEGAQISVQRAEIRRTQVFSSTTSTNLDKQQADLDYREAIQRLHDQQREQARLEQDTNKANKAGVEGSDLVTRAKQRLNDANQKIRDAEEAIRKARVDGARQIAQAEQALTQARQQGAQKIQDAERRLAEERRQGAQRIAQAEDGLTQARLDGARKVAQAEDNLANTRRTSAFSVASAQQSVIEAQRALAQAQTQVGQAATKQSAAQAALAAAMAKLSPAGRSFVTFLLNTLIPAWDKVKNATQQALLPPVQRGLTAMLPLLGILQTGMVQTAKIVGGAFESLARNYLATPLFKRDMATIMASNNRAFATLLTALTPIVRAFTDLTVASEPLLQRFADFIASSAILVSNFIHTQRETGGLARFFQLAGDTAAQLGRIAWNLVTAIFNIGKAARPAGQKLLDSFEGVTKKWADWTKSMEGQNKLKAYFDKSVEAVKAVGRLIHDIVIDIFDLGNDNSLAGKIEQIRTEVLPAVKRIADNLKGAFGQALLTAIGKVATTLADLTDGGGGGALTTFVTTLGDMADIIDKILKLPGVAPVAAALAGIAGGVAAISLVLGPVIKGVGLIARTGVFNGLLKLLGINAAEAAGGVGVLDGAMTLLLGPVGLVILAVALIGGALYELYQHWAPFRNFIDGQVKSMGTALTNLGKMWTWLKDETGRELGILGDDVKRVFGAISKDWDQTKRDVGAMRDSIGRAVGKIRDFFAGLGKSISDWWNATVKPTWGRVVNGWNSTRDAIGRGKDRIVGFFADLGRRISDWWTRTVSTTWTKAVNGWNSTRDAIGRGKDRIVGFFADLGRRISDWWTRTVSPTWARVVSGWNSVRDNISRAVDRIKGFFAGLGKSILSVSRGPITTAFNGIKSALGKVRDAFGTAVSAIGKLWNNLRGAVTAPVKFVIDTIYNNGIRALWNKVADLVHLPTLNKLTVPGINGVSAGTSSAGRQSGGRTQTAMATGGVLPGYAPGVDVVNAVLSPGEGVLVPEAVRGLARMFGTGADHAIRAINSTFSSRVAKPPRALAGGLPGFAGGGIFSWIGDQIGKGASAAKSFVGNELSSVGNALKNLVAGALSGPLHAAATPLHGLINRVLPSSPPFVGALRGMMNTGVDKAVDFISGKDATVNAPTGGGGGGAISGSRVPNVGSGVERWRALVIKALSASGLSTGLADKVLRQMQTESGGNPNAVQGNIGDINNRTGDLAKGFMQVIGATFRAFHVNGTSWNIFDPWANLMAALNYAKHRYGSSLSFLGQGHGYSLGGIVPAISRMALGGTAKRPPVKAIQRLFSSGDTGRQLLDGVKSTGAKAARPVVAAVSSRLHSSGDTGAQLLQQILAGGTRLFDSGGVLNPGATLAVNATGQNEFILTGSQWDSVAKLAASAVGGGRPVVHEPTAAERLAGAQIQIDVHPQPGTDARAVAREVAVELGWMLR